MNEFLGYNPDVEKADKGSGLPEFKETNIDALVEHLLNLRGEEFIAALQDIDPTLHREVALKVIEADRGSIIAQCIDQFEGIDYNEIAHKLLQADRLNPLLKNLGKFSDLDDELLDNGPRYVAQSPEELAEGIRKLTGRDDIADNMLRRISALRKIQGRADDLMERYVEQFK